MSLTTIKTTTNNYSQYCVFVLDDLIKARREQEALQKKSQSNQDAGEAAGNKRGKNKRVSIKAQATSKQQTKPTNVQKSIGSNKAKRNAKISSKRGVSDSSKATPMQVEREVYRQSRTGRNAGGAGTGATKQNESAAPPRRSRRLRSGQKNANEARVGGNAASSNKSLADQKTKQKNVARQKKQVQQEQAKTNQGNEEVIKPPKKVIGVAKKAMQDAGFVPPKGMKMVVSFVPTDTSKNSSNGNAGKKSKQGDKSNEAGQQQNKTAGSGSRKGRWNNRNNGGKMVE